MCNYLTAAGYVKPCWSRSRRVEEARAAIDGGERPVFHVVTSWDGAAVDVRIRELPRSTSSCRTRTGRSTGPAS